MGMDKGGFAITAEKVCDSVWDPKGIIGFNRLRVKTPRICIADHFPKDSGHSGQPFDQAEECNHANRPFQPDSFGSRL